ncbi:hypothetical protein [Pyxidicoccus fallax]|nr:hypothetical protein [Pyxidicoccus fallax]
MRSTEDAALKQRAMGKLRELEKDREAQVRDEAAMSLRKVGEG